MGKRLTAQQMREQGSAQFFPAVQNADFFAALAGQKEKNKGAQSQL